MTFSTIILSLAFLLASESNFVDACTCLPSTVFSSYRRPFNSAVFKANIIGELRSSCNEANKIAPDQDVIALPQFCDRIYVAWISRTFKGCPPKSKIVYFVTPSSSAACGVRLSSSKTWLLFASPSSPIPGFRARPTFRISSCTSNKPWASVTKEEIEFLNSRESECDGVPYCSSGNNDRLLLKCAEACPACVFEEKGLTCETSLCRGCGLDAADVFDSQTLEPAQCPVDRDDVIKPRPKPQQIPIITPGPITRGTP